MRMFLFSLARELGILHPDFIVHSLTPAQLREWVAYSNIISKQSEERITKSSPTKQVKAETPNQAAEMFRLIAEAAKRKKDKK